jgi:hypothetical protein
MRAFFAFILSLFSLVNPLLSAHADLGGDESKISDENRNHKVKSHKRKSMTGYAVHEITMDSTVVKQYVTSSGKIFAVSWQGMRVPDLKTLFGAYYTEYENEKAQTKVKKGHRSIGMTTSNLVVSQGGTMRDMHGFAYLPSALPHGLKIEDLK